MKNPWDAIQGSGWENALFAYVLCSAVAALLCSAAFGLKGLVSSLLASSVYVVPSVLLIALVKLVTGGSPWGGAILLKVGLLIRVVFATALICVVAMFFKSLCWPAFLFSLFTVANAPVAGQLLKKQG